jgi:hypothetical protein
MKDSRWNQLYVDICESGNTKFLPYWSKFASANMIRPSPILCGPKPKPSRFDNDTKLVHVESLLLKKMDVVKYYYEEFRFVDKEKIAISIHMRVQKMIADGKSWSIPGLFVCSPKSNMCFFYSLCELAYTDRDLEAYRDATYAALAASVKRASDNEIGHTFECCSFVCDFLGIKYIRLESLLNEVRLIHAQKSSDYSSLTPAVVNVADQHACVAMTDYKKKFFSYRQLGEAFD